MVVTMNKQTATEKCNEINALRGFRLYTPAFLGASIAPAYGLDAGWYLFNRETRTHSTEDKTR